MRGDPGGGGRSDPAGVGRRDDRGGAGGPPRRRRRRPPAPGRGGAGARRSRHRPIGWPRCSVVSARGSRGSAGPRPVRAGPTRPPCSGEVEHIEVSRAVASGSTSAGRSAWACCSTTTARSSPRSGGRRRRRPMSWWPGSASSRRAGPADSPASACPVWSRGRACSAPRRTSPRWRTCRFGTSWPNGSATTRPSTTTPPARCWPSPHRQAQDARTRCRHALAPASAAAARRRRHPAGGQRLRRRDRPRGRRSGRPGLPLRAARLLGALRFRFGAGPFAGWRPRPAGCPPRSSWPVEPPSRSGGARHRGRSCRRPGGAGHPRRLRAWSPSVWSTSPTCSTRSCSSSAGGWSSRGT